MKRNSVLVVEDNPEIRELISYNLGQEGYEVYAAEDGEKALALLDDTHPALVVLDLMLPGMHGLDICRHIRTQPEYGRTAIMMVTAKGAEEDIVEGYEAGADDYIVKPFSPNVLRARAKTLLRRWKRRVPGEEEVINIGGLLIHPGRHEVLADQTPVPLTTSEFKVLHLLARQPGWVYSRSQIVSAVRKDDYQVTDRAIDVVVFNLRQKLGEHKRCVETVRGAGYRFADADG